MKISNAFKVGFSALVMTIAATGAQAQGFGRGGFGGHGGGFGGGRPDFDSYTVTCESINYRSNRCFVGNGIRDVDLQRQLSNASCVQGRSWGYDRNSIWVSNGCRANFRVTAVDRDHGDFGGRGPRGPRW